ncbi:MAG: hypothetical protein RI988_3059 [Pseudomonadota bacterium]|jgi:hypothetical protein
MNTPISASSAGRHAWRFFRSGGFDQVRIDRADDLRHLDELDQKLWAVLACPSSGLEFDGRTLELLDANREGHVGASEIREAARFVCAALRDPGLIFEPGDTVPLEAFDTDTPTGAQLAATARQALSYLGKADTSAIALADLADSARLFEPGHLNGDGIVPAALAQDPALAEAITLIGATLGPRADRSGEPGIDRALLDTFFADARAVCDWHDRAHQDGGAVLSLGEATADAVAAFDAVREKVEDWFTRCRLAAFDPRAEQALNPAEAVYAGLSGEALSAAHEGVAALPLARVATGLALPLRQGLNPAWQARMDALREQVVRPMLGEREALDPADWASLAARLEAWRGWQADRPMTPVAGVEAGTLRALLGSDTEARLAELIARDEDADTAADELEELERLLRLRRDFATLLRNFVNLADFYDPARHAIFQAGTLYLDQRSCELVLRVGDMGRHAAMAPLSGTFLVYCQCTRPGEAPITIVAAMTAGAVDDMMVPGRNGVFYDRQGQAWHASVVRIVTNPISVRQAFWAPYQRVAKMIGDQVQKFAAARDQAVDTQAGAGITQGVKTATAPPPAASGASAAKAAAAPAVKPVAPVSAAKPASPAAAAPGGAPAAGPAPFDVGKFAGIFAAIGLALGAIGTALAALVSGFLALPAWKMPLVLAGIVLLISGPSMVLAWLKLRRRNLGPLLDANGWAVNIRARINLPFGASLTQLPQRPASALLATSDPFAEPGVRWGRWLVLAAVLLGAFAWLVIGR